MVAVINITPSQSMRAETVQGPEADQLDHGVRQPGRRRAEHEGHDRELVSAFAPEQVAELAPQRGGRGRGERVRAHDPRNMFQPTQIGGDRGQ
jgi:hypothetical protein